MPLKENDSMTQIVELRGRNIHWKSVGMLYTETPIRGGSNWRNKIESQSLQHIPCPRVELIVSMIPESRGCESTATFGLDSGIHLLIKLFTYSISLVLFHRWAVRCAKALESCANRLQLESFGKRVSSAGARVIIVTGGNGLALVFEGYMPQKACWRDSKALGIGVARRYIISASCIVEGIKCNWST